MKHREFIHVRVKTKSGRPIDGRARSVEAAKRWAEAQIREGHGQSARIETDHGAWSWTVKRPGWRQL